MKRFRQSLSVMGGICLILSAVHVPWLSSLTTFVSLNPMSETQLLSYQLLVAAVIMFLAYMGINALIIATIEEISLIKLKLVSGLMLIFFVCRLLVEFVYPLQIPLLGFERPTDMVKLLLCVPIGILLFPFFFPGDDGVV